MKNVLMLYRKVATISEFRVEYNKYKGDNVTFVAENDIHRNLCRLHLKESDTFRIITIKELMEGVIDDMRYDFIVGNPPYQKIVGPNKTQSIWAGLVVKFYIMLKDKGTMSVIHPSGWRFLTPNSRQDVKDVNKIYGTNKIIKMEFNDYTKGKEVFLAGTDYDVITVQKTPSSGDVLIKTKSGDYKMNISNRYIIPTDNIGLFEELRAEGESQEEKVDILYSRSAYGSDKKHMSQQSQEFQYPCIYGMPQKGIKYLYSNTKDNGHFGVPKLIFTKASLYSVLDLKGEFGLTQFAYGVVDTKENLVKIQKVLECPKFRAEIQKMNGINVKGYGDGMKSLATILKEFRKDFWKEFYETEIETS